MKSYSLLIACAFSFFGSFVIAQSEYDYPFSIKAHFGHTQVSEGFSSNLFKPALGLGLAYQSEIRKNKNGRIYLTTAIDYLVRGSKRQISSLEPYGKVEMNNPINSIRMSGSFGYKYKKYSIELGIGILRHVYKKTIWYEIPSNTIINERDDYHSFAINGIDPLSLSAIINLGYQISPKFKMTFGYDLMELRGEAGPLSSVFRQYYNQSFQIGLQRYFAI